MTSEAEIKSVILNILSENNAISLATTGGEYSPWILGAYFASEDLTIYLLLEKSGKTLANLKVNSKGALLISQNDAMKDFLQAEFVATLLPDSEEARVRQLLVSKMPWYQTYTPCAPVRLDVQKWFVSSLSRQWFPAKVLDTSLINA
ncbi:MAG: pyridoxamine 5'-phosphate oxidase family protein [Chloroherpetonaceae bacterium]